MLEILSVLLFCWLLVMAARARQRERDELGEARRKLGRIDR